MEIRSQFFKRVRIILIFMVWPLLLAAGLILGALALSDDKPRCPDCKGFVKKNSRMCKKCGSLLRWD